MLSSISPVGESARGQRWPLTVSAYLAASALAGAVLGAALGTVGELVLDGVGTGVRAGVLAVGLLLGLVADRAGRVPSVHRQVDERWLGTYRGWVYGAGFGAQLGVGVATIVPASIGWLVWLAALLVAGPLPGLAVGATCGTARALPLLAWGWARTVARLREAMRVVERLRNPATWVTTGGQLTVAVAAVVLALRDTM